MSMDPPASQASVEVVVSDLYAAVATFGLVEAEQSEGGGHYVSFLRQGSQLFQAGVRPGHHLVAIVIQGVAQVVLTGAHPRVERGITPSQLMEQFQSHPQRLRGLDATLVFRPSPQLLPSIIHRRDDDMCLLLAECLNNGGGNEDVAIRRHVQKALGSRNGYHQLKQIAFTANAASSHHFIVAIGDDDALNGESTTPVYICFQNTQTLQHVMTDMKALARPPMRDAIEGNVHLGFLEVAETIPIEPFLNLLRDTKANKRHRLVFCGHSLGGALAQLVALRVLLRCDELCIRQNVHVAAFGAPLVGDDKFAAQFEKQFGHTHVARKNCRFYVNKADIVPRVLVLLTRAFEGGSKSMERQRLTEAILKQTFQPSAPQQATPAHAQATADQPAEDQAIWSWQSMQQAASSLEQVFPKIGAELQMRLPGLMSMLPGPSDSNLWSKLASCLQALARTSIQCNYSAFGTYLIRQGEDWVPHTEPESIREALFKSTSLRNLNAGLLQYHMLMHYQQGCQLTNRRAWYPQQGEALPSLKVDNPDFSAPQKMEFQPLHSSITSTPSHQQHHLAFTGKGFAFVTHVTSSLDEFGRQFFPLYLEHCQRLEVTITCKKELARSVFEVRFHTIFSTRPTTIMVDVTQLSDLPMSGKLSAVAKLPRDEVINQAVLLTLFSHDQMQQEKVLDILTQLESGAISSPAERWLSKNASAVASEEVLMSSVASEQSKNQATTGEAIPATAAHTPGESQDRTPAEPARSTLQTFVADHLRTALNAVLQNARTDKATKEDAPSKIHRYRDVPQAFQSDAALTAHEAVKLTAQSTRKVLARTGFPDIAVRSGLTAMVAASFVAAGIGLVALGSVGTASLVVIEPSFLLQGVGAATALCSSGVLYTIKRNQIEYQKNVQLMLRLLTLDAEDVPSEPMYFAEKAIVTKGIAQKMKAVVGHPFEPADLVTDDFVLKYFSKVRSGGPLYDISDDATARKRALMFLRDVWLIYRLRTILADTFMFGIVGTTKTGKSTLLSRLNFKAVADSAINTMRIQFHKWPQVKHIVFVDFPGNDDVNHAVRDAFSSHYSILDACIFVVEADKSNTMRVQETFLMALKHDIPVLLCFNKADLLLVHTQEDNDDRDGTTLLPDDARRQACTSAAEHSDYDDDDGAADYGDGGDDEDDGFDGYDDFLVLGPSTPLRSEAELQQIMQKRLDALLGDGGAKMSPSSSKGMHSVETHSSSEQVRKFDTCFTCFTRELSRAVEPQDLQERGILTPVEVLKRWLFPTLKRCNVPFRQSEHKAVLESLRRRPKP